MDGTRVVDTITFTGDPTPAQSFLRITEVMYNPGPESGTTQDRALAEFIELRNTGTTTIDISGVRFAGGITFTLNGSFAGVAGKAYTIQWSTSLTNGTWTNLSNHTSATTGNVPFTDTPPANTPRRFYRAVTPQQ
jgi:hypothetical protein